MTMFIAQNLLVSPSFRTTLSLSSFTSKTHFKAPIFASILSPPRLFIPSVSTTWNAFKGADNDNAREAMLAIRSGMFFLHEDLWQRALSLYYLDRFEEGVEQFRLDVAQNPNDTEESIWYFLCEAQLYGVDEARKQYLEVGRDPRPVTREAYNMFKDGGDHEKVDAHIGVVNDLAFAHPNKQLGIVTCGNDKLIKVDKWTKIISL